MYIHPKDKQRFWDNVDIRGEDECWNWQGRIGPDGFGRIVIVKKYLGTHRLAYEFKKSLLLFGERIEHSCANRLCCNPDHIQLTEASAQKRRERENARELVEYLP